MKLSILSLLFAVVLVSCSQFDRAVLQPVVTTNAPSGNGPTGYTTNIIVRPSITHGIETAGQVVQVAVPRPWSDVFMQILLAVNTALTGYAAQKTRAIKQKQNHDNPPQP